MVSEVEDDHGMMTIVIIQLQITRNIEMQMQNMLIVTKFQFQVNNQLWTTHSSEFYSTLWECINSTGFDLAQPVSE